MNKVLITDYVHHELITGLRNRGVHVIYAPEVPYGKVFDWIADCTAIIVNTRTPVGKDLLDAAPGLRFIGRLGVGLDIFDLEEAERRGIRVIATPGANANAVGEHMVGMLLCLLRNINRADRSIRQGHWIRERYRGPELKGKTIGIIGFGNTGSAFASKFAGWQTKVLAYDKYKERYSGDFRFVQEVDLETVLRESDVISLHVPLTDETRYMVDEGFLSKCRRGVILLNGSRGKVVDTVALIKALEEGRVGGACLDVLENEHPWQYSPEEKEIYGRLYQLNNVVLTPHIAGWTHSSKLNIAGDLLAKIFDERTE